MDSNTKVLSGFEYVGGITRPRTSYAPERTFTIVRCKTCQALVPAQQQSAHRGWHMRLRDNFKQLGGL